MENAKSIVDKIRPDRALPDDSDIVLGLPLESGDRTIYPVFRDPTSGNRDVQPRQIGYLEVSEERSDYTSLEPDRRPLAVIPVLLLLVFILWMVRRSRA